MKLHSIRCFVCRRHVPVYLVYQDDSPEEADSDQQCGKCAVEGGS